jgi:hypothetical protein
MISQEQISQNIADENLFLDNIHLELVKISCCDGFVKSRILEFELFPAL